MKESFFKKNSKTIGIVAAILGFALLTLIYFYPVLKGERIKQHDTEMWQGMAEELIEYRESTGEQSLWTNSMFGGMPAWNITFKQPSNLFYHVHNALSLGFPTPIGSVFITMLGFFLLLMVLDCGFGISLIGALAYGLSSYLFIIIGAGHNNKAFAIAYMAPVIAGILLAYKGKYWWGWLLTAFALALELKVNHLQITYYLFITVLLIVIAEFISDLREKKTKHFFKASAGLVVAAAIAIMTSFTILYANYEYGKETTRGKPILTDNSGNTTSGLDRDYITQWSYGIGETWSLLIPNTKGGASAYIGKQNTALDKADRQFRDSIAQSNAYWGDQPGTSGPVYVGAIVVFLFLLGALTVKGKLKWALVAATLLSILLSWGKNFMGFTDFFIDYVPGYSKFRAVSMTLVIAQVCMPLLGFLGLAEILKSPEDFKKNSKKFYIALGITAGCCLLFSIAPKLFFSFLSQAEASQFSQLSRGKDGALYAAFSEQLQNVRVAIFRKDALRSLVFVVLAAIPILLYGTKKIKQPALVTILTILVVADMFPIDKRYLNDSNFEPKRLFDKPFAETAADKAIFADKSLDFRVVSIYKDVFNDASTSYFHKSVGGYHGAKMRRYQDVINTYLGAEITNFRNNLKNSQTYQDMSRSLQQLKMLNMLNTKYIIYSPDAKPLLNPEAYGNAWMVNDIQWVNNANEEFDAIASVDTRHTAILNKEFEAQAKGFTPTDSISGSIALTGYKPNELVYAFQSDQDQLVVFSEIWTEKDGWHMQIDGVEHPILRADYLLRCALIPAGQHEIVMRYQPKIWKTGNIIALVTSLLIIAGCLIAAVQTLRNKKNSAQKTE